MTITCIWHGHNILGEGPIWDPRIKCLYWVDIAQGELHQLNPITNAHQQWQFVDKPSAIALRKKGGLLITFARSFAFFDPDSGKLTPWIAPLADQSLTVFNDGKCDRMGRFWIGSKDIHEKEPIGALYRLDPDGTFTQMDLGFIVSNGMGWNLNNEYFYFTDGAAHRQILRYKFDLATGTISQRTVFAKIPEHSYPDGLTLDAEDFIWSAYWEGECLTRFTPQGEIDRVVPVPVLKPTSCCFGGKNSNQLFITSARRDLTQQQLEQAPLSGNLFALEIPDIKGIAESFFEG